jgi:transcriptional regulator with XRE-family HTH domain
MSGDRRRRTGIEPARDRCGLSPVLKTGGPTRRPDASKSGWQQRRYPRSHSQISAGDWRFLQVFGNHSAGIYALMIMPERSFGRTVRYRRTKLGLSQAKLAELVGRSTPTIRSWERDKSRPNDPQVIATLSAILGIDERQLFDKAEVEFSANVETSPTVEQALATLSLEAGPVTDDDIGDDAGTESSPATPDKPVPVSVEEYQLDLVAMGPTTDEDEDIEEQQGIEEKPLFDRLLVGTAARPGPAPAYVAPPEPYVQTPVTPSLIDLSYMEDAHQRQLYRVRNLATLVAAVALVLALIWALGEGIGALGEWWDDFFGNLRL